MKPTVFIHTNHRQMVGALVSRYSLKRNSTRADDFDNPLVSLLEAGIVFSGPVTDGELFTVTVAGIP